MGGVESNPSRAESPGYFVTIENSEAASSSGKFGGPSSLESLSVDLECSYRSVHGLGEAPAAMVGGMFGGLRHWAKRILWNSIARHNLDH